MSNVLNKMVDWLDYISELMFYPTDFILLTYDNVDF